MKQLTRPFLAILAAHALTFAVSASAGEPAEPETITIAGKTYTVVPDEQMRALGFEFGDVAPEENAATYYLRAIEAYEAFPDDEGELDKLREAVVRQGWTDESAPLVAYLEKNRETLKLIRQAATKSACHFPVLLGVGESLEDVAPTDIRLPHLVAMRDFARFLVMEGRYHESQGRLADAFDVYLLTCVIGGHAAQDPGLMNGLVGMACTQIGMRPIEQCLVRHETEAATLADVQKQLRALYEGRPRLVVAMRGERAFAAGFVEAIIRNPRSIWETTGGEPGFLAKAAVGAMLADEKCQAQMRQDVVDFWDMADRLMKLPLPEFIRSSEADDYIEAARARRLPINVMAMLGPGITTARIVYDRNDMLWTVLDVELALARYKAQHGRYPETLDEAKDLMLMDGIDPFSGERLKYRREDDGSFTLWSVGENLVDDGGDETLVRKHWGGPDYVWTSRE